MGGTDERQAGFTLLEMVVALAIAALAFSIGVVGIAALKGRVTPMRLAYQIAGAMNAARIGARDHGSEQSVTIDLKARRVSGEGSDGAVIVPEDYALSVVAGRETVTDAKAIQIRFLPDGTSSGGEILITSPGGDRARVDINWLTGLSRVSDAGS